MLDTLKKLLLPPVFEDDEEKTRAAALLNIVLWSLLLGVLSYSFFAPIEPEIRIRRYIIVGPLIIILLSLIWATHRGHIYPAGHAIVFALWFALSMAMVYGAGFNNPAFMGYIVVVVCSGLILGQKATIFWAVVSILSSAATLYASQIGVLPKPTANLPGLTIWVAQCLYILTTALLLSLARRSINEGFVRARHELNERRLAEEKLRDSEQRFRAVIEHSWEGLTLLDADGTILYSSPATTRILGYDLDSRLGHPGFEHLHPDDVSAARDLLLGALKAPGQSLTGQVRYQHQNGNWVWLEFTVINMIEQPEIGAILAHFFDVTERKLAEDQIRQLNVELEERVRERTSQFESANRELESFSYSVSHDLRAPLRGIDGLSRILLDEHSSQLNSAARGYLQQVRKNAEYMGQLIDNLLAFSRLSRQPIRVQTIKTTQLIQEVLAELRGGYGQKQVDILIGDLPDCEADPALLRLVFVNLIDNAFKYSSKRENARIEIGCQVQDGENVYFVRDNGAGFDMQYADKLFGVFQRLHPDQEFEGTGVGLAIVQRIIQRHGGRIWAEAEVDRGATFYFALSK